MSLLIHNVTIFTNDDRNAILTGHAVAIEGSQITKVGPEAELKKTCADFQQLDGGGRLLLPGFVNAHMHFYGTFARGLALEKTPRNFYEILSFLWWQLDKALDLKSVYYSALVQTISAVKHGVTAIVDHHASPNAVEGSLDQIEEAMSLLGVRGVLCYEMSDRDGREICQKGLEENARYIQKCRTARKLNPDHLYDAMVGLHASFTLDNGSLRRAAELSWATDRGCHIHLLEDGVDRLLTQEKYGTGVVKRLAEQGILGEKTIAAHGIHLQNAEFDLLASTDTIVVHNPQSNMNNAVGRADIFKLLDKKLLVGLGTDGMTASILPDIRTAHLLHKHDLRNSNVGWAEIQKMAMKNNPRIFQRLTGMKIGQVTPGYLADLILVDYFPPTPMTEDNFWGHLLFGIADAAVDTTIINGRIVMQNKQIPGLDEEGIAAHARECAEGVWKRFAVS
ncbi:MAG: putative aminohydrolase SsnA [Calditrichaeota bacterium]|nr:MAG: putative aminohydrolase SsnA [Calditrichota bacterium]